MSEDENISREMFESERNWICYEERIAKERKKERKKGFDMRLLIEDIYRQMNDISRLNTNEFSSDFLGMNPSYYRSIKSRNIEPSTGALMVLMERLHQRANAIRTDGGNHQVLQKAAARYEDLAKLIAIEIANRTLKREQASDWVRKTLLKIVSAMNEDRLNSDGSMPPIIIC